jgi:hypothetical protein
MDSDLAPESRTPYATFGWQGIGLTVPSSWDLVFTQGDDRSGCVRLADAASVRLEVLWQTAGREQNAAAILDAHLARLGKEAAKQGTAFSLERNLKLAWPVDKDAECYRWVADRQVLGMLSCCARCRRVVHLNLWGRPQERIKGLARTVFSSLSDHPDEGGALWKFLDVEFRTPAGLPLADRSLQAGCIRMVFLRRRVRLEFVRLSLAELVLRGKGLAQWFREFYAKALKRRSVAVQDGLVKGHAGLQVSGRAWTLVNPLSLLGRRRIVRGACWHCQDTNRLFICCYDGPAKQAGIFGPALESFRCCGAAAGGDDGSVPQEEAARPSA